MSKNRRLTAEENSAEASVLCAIPCYKRLFHDRIGVIPLEMEQYEEPRSSFLL